MPFFQTSPSNPSPVGPAPAPVFEASHGGRLELPALTTLSNRIKLRADGDDGLLRTPALTRVVGTDAPFEAEIRASNNARAGPGADGDRALPDPGANRRRGGAALNRASVRASHKPQTWFSHRAHRLLICTRSRRRQGCRGPTRKAED